MRTDTMGNLIVHKKGQGPKVMLAAHMDEVGMLVLGVLDNGLIAYSQRGLDPRVVVSKRVVIGDDMVEGVIGAKAIHLQTREEMKAALAHSELFVDIGAKDKDDALKYVKPGDHIAFTTRFKRLGESKVLGTTWWKKPIDVNLVGSAATKVMHGHTCVKKYSEESPVKEVTEGIANLFPAWNLSGRSVLMQTNNTEWTK